MLITTLPDIRLAPLDGAPFQACLSWTFFRLFVRRTFVPAR